MTDNTLHDDFMKLGDLSEIDNQLLNEAGQDNIIERMHEEKQKAAATRAPWMSEVKTHWFGYSLLGLSFLLTEMLALYLGTAPEMRTAADGSKYIFYHTDIPHLLTALVYMLVFPIVTELAFAYSFDRFKKRETGNINQGWTMIVAIVASVLSIIGTGVAGGYVVYSALGFFVEIPSSTKSYLVWAIPILIALFSLLHGIYVASSKREKSRKLVEEKEAEDDLADQLRTRMIERAGRRAMKAAAIRAYERSIALGLLSVSEAQDGLARGKSLAQLELELNRDLTGEGRIGDTSGFNTPPALPSPPSNKTQAPAPGEQEPARSPIPAPTDRVNELLKSLQDDIDRAKSMVETHLDGKSNGNGKSSF